MQTQSDFVQFRGLSVMPEHPAKLRAAQLLTRLVECESGNLIRRIAHIGIPGPLVCPECGAIPGEYHALKCKNEICPLCGEHLAECDCLVLYAEQGQSL